MIFLLALMNAAFTRMKQKCDHYLANKKQINDRLVKALIEAIMMD